MYFANPSMTILDVVPRHMETPENMLGCRVSPRLPCVSNGTRIIAINANRVSTTWEYTKLDDELLQPMRFFDASQAAIYSDSIVDWVTTDCLLLLQLIAPPFNINTYPVWDFESSGSVLRLAST